MQIHNMINRAFSEAEAAAIEHFCYYFDGRRCFALIGEQVVVELAGENSGDLAKLTQEAKACMQGVVSTPPDFSTYVMDDEFGLVNMSYGVFGVSREKLAAEELESGHMNIAGALAVRGECLEACQRAEIIAIYDPGL